MNSYTLVDSIQLAKKKFFRAPQWEFKLGVKILLGLLILYFLVLFLLFGMGLFHFIEKKLPGTDPILVLNQGLVYYFGTDLLIRYFFSSHSRYGRQALVNATHTKKYCSKRGLIAINTNNF